ncbi:MAG: protein translocase SEC61 complex subunit gamma [archaeon]
MVDVNEFVQSSTRIFNVSRKPDMNEYKVMAKVTGLGILLIGLIGYIVKFLLTGVIRL